MRIFLLCLFFFSSTAAIAIEEVNYGSAQRRSKQIAYPKKSQSLWDKVWEQNQEKLQLHEDILELEKERRWENFPKGTLITKLGVSSPSLQMDIRKPDGDSGEVLKYFPNVSSKILSSFTYGGLSLTISGKAGAADDETIYGKSKNVDIQLRFYGTKWSPEFFYQRYSGYYLENSGLANPGYVDGQPKYTRPDIAITNMGTNLIYNFDEESFSLSGAFDYGRRQFESGGALLGIASLTRHEIKAENSFIPVTQQSRYGAFNLIRRAEIYNLSAGLGYGYSFVFDKVNLSGMMGYAASLQQQYLTSVDNSSNDSQINTKLYAKLGAGYNGDSFLCLLTTSIDNGTAKIADAEIQYSMVEVGIYFGYRFNDLHWEWFDSFIDRNWPMSSSDI